MTQYNKLVVTEEMVEIFKKELFTPKGDVKSALEAVFERLRDNTKKLESDILNLSNSTPLFLGKITECAQDQLEYNKEITCTN